MFYITYLFFNKHVSFAHFSKSDFSVLYIKHIKSICLDTTNYSEIVEAIQAIINKSLRVNRVHTMVKSTNSWSEMVSVRIATLPSETV